MKRITIWLTVLGWAATSLAGNIVPLGIDSSTHQVTQQCILVDTAFSNSLGGSLYGPSGITNIFGSTNLLTIIRGSTVDLDNCTLVDVGNTIQWTNSLSDASGLIGTTYAASLTGTNTVNFGLIFTNPPTLLLTASNGEYQATPYWVTLTKSNFTWCLMGAQKLQTNGWPVTWSAFSESPLSIPNVLITPAVTTLDMNSNPVVNVAFMGIGTNTSARALTVSGNGAAVRITDENNPESSVGPSVMLYEQANDYEVLLQPDNTGAFRIKWRRGKSGATTDLLIVNTNGTLGYVSMAAPPTPSVGGTFYHSTSNRFGFCTNITTGWRYLNPSSLIP